MDYHVVKAESGVDLFYQISKPWLVKDSEGVEAAACGTKKRAQALADFATAENISSDYDIEMEYNKGCAK